MTDSATTRCTPARWAAATRFGAPRLHSSVAGPKSLGRFGPHFGSVVSKLTTASGANSASTASIWPASRTSATTGLAPSAEIWAVLSDERVTPITS